MPRIYHYLILAVLIVAVFLLDLRTPLGIADWLLYVIPVGYALRFLSQGRMTFSTLSVATGGLTALILLGWLLSPPGLDHNAALLNRMFGILVIWCMAMFVAWLNRRIQTLRETEAIMQRQLDEKELRLKQALDAGSMAAVEWDLRKGLVKWTGHHESLTGRGAGSFSEGYHEYLDRIHQEDRDTVREAIDRAMRKRSNYNLQYRVYAPNNQLQSVSARGRFIYRGIQPVRMVGVCVDLTDRDHAALEQSEQVVIDLEELTNNAAARETSWRKPRQWVQRVTRLGIERIRVLPRKPNEIS